MCEEKERREREREAEESMRALWCKMNKMITIYYICAM
jgi:hypothetical protein